MSAVSQFMAERPVSGGGGVPGVPPFPVPPFVIPNEEHGGEHTYVGKRKQLYCRHGVNLAVLPGGQVAGTQEPFNKYAVLEVTAVDLQEVRMRAVETGLYVAMDGRGRLYGERDADQIGCIFVEQLDGGYLTYLSKKNAHWGWYLGLKRSGRPKPGPRTRWGQKAVQFLSRRATRPV
ncbi:fibroblast growth factor 1-like isoform X2 [Pollicipes pollicipes]|uniref:fibroblast growth factor 1-like isoform X1 n=1 Tax=Pollicipes pollicipes TaxID=41117 RepID=UPI001884E413|nr:fibroblast growth factor 1-like isoform X1 [Pollicipes pollicipes]XP_037069914.1 fibroblast growth factor 1-like isoform X2 [Pollicipes pollicipes]